MTPTGKGVTVSMDLCSQHASICKKILANLHEKRSARHFEEESLGLLENVLQMVEQGPPLPQ